MTSQSWKNRFNKEELIRVGAFLAFGLLAIGFFYTGYRWYRNRSEGASQKIFSQSIEEYQRLIYAQGGTAAWQEMEQVLKKGYENNSGSATAPFFLAYQAEVLLREGKLKEATELVNKATNKLPNGSAFYYLMATKAALMKLDSEEATVRQNGQSELEKLANDEFNNPFYDMALYYLGYKSWNAGDRQTANISWSKLQKIAGKSFWADLSRRKEGFLS